MFDQDPTESDEATAECWAAENVDGDNFKCQCGEWKPLAGSSPSGPSPYAIPICRECAEDFSPLGVFCRTEVQTDVAGVLVALVGSDDDGTTYWEPWEPCKSAEQTDEVVDRIRGQFKVGLDVQIGCQPGDTWLATFTGEDKYQGDGPTARVATCRAALKVLAALDWKGKPDAK